MIVATCLELLMLAAFVRSRSIAGELLWCAYLYYSATWASLRALAQWLNDNDGPPPGAA